MSLVQPATALLPADQPLPRPGDEPDEAYTTPGDGLRPRWQTNYSPAQVMALWDDGDEVAAGSVEHGDDGEARISLPTTRRSLAPGPYRLRYTTVDDFGAEFETRMELVVAAPERTVLALPAVLMAERASVAGCSNRGARG